MPRTSNPTWRQLARLEPELARLERDVRSVEASKSFCANLAWYRQFKPRLVTLVGYARRHDECARTNDPPALGADRGFYCLGDVLGPKDRRGRLRTHRHDRIREHEVSTGLAVLWTSGVYDLAYDHLYALLPDCGDDCACSQALEAMTTAPFWEFIGSSDGDGPLWEWAHE